LARNPTAAPRAAKSPSPKTYEAHRERQRRRILDAAEKLFHKYGIDRVTMADITSASGLRAATIYQYFSNKEDIVWSLEGEFIKDYATRAAQAMSTATTGLDKIAAIFQLMAGALAEDPAKVRFTAQFDALYARHWPAERMLTLEAQVVPDGVGRLGDLIREGISDGSLRADLDPDLTLQAVINALLAAQQRLASLGNKVELEYGQPVNRLYSETIRVIILGLQAPRGKQRKSK
jgi:AcrR family transcriptional regulator